MRKPSGPDWVPNEVLLSHPSDNEEAPCCRIFGAPVRFDQEGTALIFEARWLFEKAAAAFGHVDILVNNAGIYEFGDLAGITPESIDR